MLPAYAATPKLEQLERPVIVNEFKIAVLFLIDVEAAIYPTTKFEPWNSTESIMAASVRTSIDPATAIPEKLTDVKVAFRVVAEVVMVMACVTVTFTPLTVIVPIGAASVSMSMLTADLSPVTVTEPMEALALAVLVFMTRSAAMTRFAPAIVMLEMEVEVLAMLRDPIRATLPN